LDPGLVLAIVGIAVPFIAFVWEFVVVGRKQLGYRVQMDTRIAPNSTSSHSAALTLLTRSDGRQLTDASLVLVRIENSGTTHLVGDDYISINDADENVGMELHFPGRKVIGMEGTEFSASYIRLGEAFSTREITLPDGRTAGVIYLPKVALNRRDHFKVLALLDRTDPPGNGNRRDPDPPWLRAGITGGGTRGVRRTRSRMGVSWLTAVMICILAVSVVETGRSVLFAPAPLDCAAGRLTLTGSTAFAPVVEEAANLYSRTCPGASFTSEFTGSVDGMRRLNQAASTDVLAFSDGAKGDGFPQLLPRATAFSLFTMVVHPQAGVQDLSRDQILRIYDGQLSNWKEIGGNDQPIRLVSRSPDSGTRQTFQQQILGGRREPGTNSDDCQRVDPGAEPGVVRCERSSTTELLDTVANTPGAVGYSELGAVTTRSDVLPARIDGHEATLESALHQAYPFWQTEYAYTYGQPHATSLAASFLRYLTNEVGQDVIRSHGLRPCIELGNPVLCQP
jgi:phosphate transport system substrate-binding protein